MTYAEFLKYPLKVMTHRYGQKVVIYSISAIFILLSVSQNLNVAFPSLFEPIIKGCENLVIEYTTAHKAHDFIKIILYDVFVISSGAWLLHKYKFCVFTLTGFYAVAISRLTWSFLLSFGVENRIVDITTTSILDFAWITILIYKLSKIKRN